MEKEKMLVPSIFFVFLQCFQTAFFQKAIKWNDCLETTQQDQYMYFNLYVGWLYWDLTHFNS